MLKFHVGGKVVEVVDLLKKRHNAWRLDVLPFAVLYSIWLFLVIPSLDFTDALIVLGSLSAFHILVLLFTAWSVDFKCFVRFRKVSEIRSADSCKVTPAKFCGAKEIVPLHIQKSVVGPSSSNVEEIYFDFRKQRFIFSDQKETFCKLPYPTNETFGYYLKSTGHGTDAKVATDIDKWGRNVSEKGDSKA